MLVVFPAHGAPPYLCALISSPSSRLPADPRARVCPRCRPPPLYFTPFFSFLPFYFDFVYFSCVLPFSGVGGSRSRISLWNRQVSVRSLLQLVIAAFRPQFWLFSGVLVTFLFDDVIINFLRARRPKLTWRPHTVPGRRVIVLPVPLDVFSVYLCIQLRTCPGMCPAVPPAC